MGRSACLLGFLAFCLASGDCSSVALLEISLILLHISVCMSLCLCLGYCFVPCKSEFDFLRIFGIEKVCADYLPSGDFLLLAAILHAVRHVYVWLWGEFLIFQLSFFLPDFFFELLWGPAYAPKTS